MFYYLDFSGINEYLKHFLLFKINIILIYLVVGKEVFTEARAAMNGIKGLHIYLFFFVIYIEILSIIII